MKINDLSKELGVKNKELITYLKQAGFKVSSHMQNADEDMIQLAQKHFDELKKSVYVGQEKTSEEIVSPAPTVESSVSTKKFLPDDQILCKSVCPWKLNITSMDKQRTYFFEGWGAEDYVAYRDLQSWRRQDIITGPKLLIEDPDLVSQWRRDIGNIYKQFLGVDYPEDLFDKSDDDFEKFLRTADRTVREIVKFTAMSMIRAENYPAVSKIKIIDDVTGTMLMDFLS